MKWLASKISHWFVHHKKLPAKAKNILVVRRGAIGDVLMTTPFLSTVKKRYPNAKITYLAGQWASSVLKNNPNIDDLIVKREDSWPGVWNISMLFRWGRELRQRNFDIVFLLSMPDSGMNIMLWLAKIKHRAGFSYGNDIALTKTVQIKKDSFIDTSTHRVKFFLKILDEENPASNPQLRLSKEEINWAKKLLLEENIYDRKPIVAIAPGGGSNPGMEQSTKRWPLEKFCKLINEITEGEDFPGQVLLVGAGQIDEKIVEEMYKSLENKRFVTNLVGKLKLRQTAAILSFCHILVANDSGVMHLGAALDIPTVALFGATNPKDCSPYGTRSKILYDDTCEPCYTENCPVHGSYSCLSKIEVEEVLQAITELLTKKE